MGNAKDQCLQTRGFHFHEVKIFVGLFATAMLACSIKRLNNRAKLSSKVLSLFLQGSVCLNDSGVCELFTSHSHSLSAGMRIRGEKKDH